MIFKVESATVPLLKPSKRTPIKTFKREHWLLTPRLESCYPTEKKKKLGLLTVLPLKQEEIMGEPLDTKDHVCFGVCRR